ncbi:MAG: glycosyltransferase family 2 protein [Thermodesulfobacteriota bacterium]
MNSINIAVLMTCHNRKESTLSCIRKLISQENITDINLKIYLVEDGCTDGTGDAARNLLPDIILLRGNGELYWGGGMRLAFGEALKENYDFYLWLNDDTMLYPHAVRTMLDTSHYLKKEIGRDAILAGAMRDSVTGVLTYGGSIRRRSWSPRSYIFVTPTNKPEPCDVINGNCVLIPHNIATSVGNISKDFTHRLGDCDYSLRAKSKGFSSWIAPGYLGTCSRNSLTGTFKDKNLSLKNRVGFLENPTAATPAKEWMLFVKRHGGIFWPIFWSRAFVRMKFPRIWVWLRSSRV